MPSQILLPLSATLEFQWRATTEKHGIIGEAHLFLAILENEEDATIAALLALSGVSRQEARLYAQSALEESPNSDQKLKLSRGASQGLKLAAQEAALDGSSCIETHHLFIACIGHRRGAHLGEVLRPLGLDAAQLRRHARELKKQDAFTPRARQALEVAQAEMRASYCGRISSAHLLLGVLSDEDNFPVALVREANFDLETLRNAARDSIKNDGEIATPQKRFSPGAKRALERAAREAKRANCKFIDCGHLLLALLPQRETLGEKWRARGRKLDGVDELWTAAQVEALRLALGNPAKGTKRWRFKLSFTTSGLTLTQGVFLLILSSVGAFLWVRGLTPPPVRGGPKIGFLPFLAGTILYVLPAIAAALLFGRSPRTKIEAFLSILIGWVFGAAAGIFLFIIL